MIPPNLRQDKSPRDDSKSTWKSSGNQGCVG